MKFLFDHDVPDELAYALRAAGHDVQLLRNILPTTSIDDEVLRTASDRNAVLITCNRDDFVAAASRMTHHGIIIVIRRRSRALERAALIRLVDSAGEEGLRGNINFA